MPIEAAELYGALLLQCITWAVLMPALVRPGSASWTPRHLCSLARRTQGWVVLQACGWLLLWAQANRWLNLPSEGLRPLSWLLLAAVPGNMVLMLLAWRAQTRTEQQTCPQASARASSSGWRCGSNCAKGMWPGVSQERNLAY